MSSQFEQPYTAVPGPFGEPELSEASKHRAANEELGQGARIGPGKSGAGPWLENLEADIRQGTGVTAPGRVLKSFGAQGTESGVSPGVAETIGGTFVGPVRAARGLKQALGPFAGESGDVSSELHGLNEAMRGGMQTLAPLAAADPEALAVLPAYGVGGELAERGLEKVGVPPESAELASNVALLGGGLAHAGTAEPRAPFGGTYEGGATEPLIAGETAPDYLKGLTDKTRSVIENTRRAERINAPFETLKTPETTAPPPILSRPAPRSPLDELSAQADQVRQGRDFRKSLTQEIADGITSRLRDEGLLEEPRPSVVDRRAVRPEDVEPYQPPRTFIGGENVPASVVPQGRELSRLLENEPPPKPSAQDMELGFRPANASRMLPPASPEKISQLEQGEQRYNEALGRARTYGQPQPLEVVEPAAAKDISADSRRVANLAIGRFKNPIEQQYARDVWQSIIKNGQTPEIPYGMTRVDSNQIQNRLARISRGDIGGRVPDPRTIYEPDVLDEARAMMDHTHGFLSQQERPGRYFADMGDEISLTGRGPKVPVTAVTSLRGQFPWFANLKESPGDLEKALRLGKGPGYDRLITAAADHIVRTRTETQQMAHSVEPDIDNLAEQVRSLDPELADFLSNASRGNVGTWTETQRQRLDTIEGRITDARTALEFGRAVDDLADAERAGNEPAPQTGEEETSQARGEAGTGPRATEAFGKSSVGPLEDTLPGLEDAVREQKRAAITEQGRRLGEEAAQPLGNIEERAGTMERESPLFRGTEASPQNEMFPPRRGEAGFVSPGLARDLLSGRLTKEAYQKYIAQPVIEKGLGLGDKYAKVEKADPDVAAGLHLLDNAPAYFRAKAARSVHNVIDGLSRAQERLFSLMADEDSRENLRTNHPEEYRRAMDDPAIQDALRTYRPMERQLTAARERVGGATLDRDYLRRVYDRHIAGVGQAEAPEASERANTAFDRVIQPQQLGNMSREATAEYHYQNGLHEFGPAFGTKFLATNLRALENQIAQDFISKATEIAPGETQPRAITYNGEKYYRPDVARDMRDAGQKDVETYDMYDPSAGVKYPQKGQSLFLGPSEVVRALNDHGTGRESAPGPVRRFLQEQTIGFGFGIPHVANILRRVTQSAPLGAANPQAWVGAWKVAFGSELRARGLRGLDDPTFDRLMQQGSITTGEMANLKSYWGGNLNPANWARSLASIGHKLIFEPGSFGGLGGVDQRARLYIADLVKAQNPELDDAQVARAVNTQLGDYNRMNWNDRQKLLSKFMLFPGWDTSSIKWVIQHPIKTTVPPALIVLAANQVLNRLGYNRNEDTRDISNIHFGDRSIGLTILRESMARNLARPVLNYAQSRITGESNARALGEVSRGLGQAAGGLVGTLRPDITAGIDLAMNRESPFGGQELVGKNDSDTPGRVLPNRALEKQAALVVRHAVPSLDRMLDSDESIDFASFAGSNLGMPNYKSGAEQRLKRNTGEAMEVSQTLSRLAKSDRAAARRFIQDPDNAAYAMFRNDLDKMSKTLKRLDDAKESIDSAKTLTGAEKRERQAHLDHARQNLLRNADGLDRLLFERKQERRERANVHSPAFVEAHP